MGYVGSKTKSWSQIRGVSHILIDSSSHLMKRFVPMMSGSSSNVGHSFDWIFTTNDEKVCLEDLWFRCVGLNMSHVLGSA